MNCEHYRKRLSKQADRELDRASAEELEEHLAACPECRLFRDGMESLGREIRVIGVTQLPIGLAERVKGRVARERERRLDSVFIPAWSRVPLVALITLAAVGLGNVAGSSISAMFTSERTDDTVEYLLVSQSPSFADALMDTGNEENGQ